MRFLAALPLGVLCVLAASANASDVQETPDGGLALCLPSVAVSDGGCIATEEWLTYANHNRRDFTQSKRLACGAHVDVCNERAYCFCRPNGAVVFADSARVARTIGAGIDGLPFCEPDHFVVGPGGWYLVTDAGLQRCSRFPAETGIHDLYKP